LLFRTDELPILITPFLALKRFWVSAFARVIKPRKKQSRTLNRIISSFSKINLKIQVNFENEIAIR
jgi:hypothetical protein